MEIQRTWSSQNNLEKRTKLEELYNLTSKLTKKLQESGQCSTSMDRQISQWNRIKSLEISLYIYGQLILNKGVKAIH